MKHSPADILRYYFTSFGMCVDPEVTPGGPWLGYVNVMIAEDVDTAIVFSDTQGIPFGRNLRTGETLEHPGIQVLVRSGSQIDAWRKARAVGDIFDAILRQKVVYEEEAYGIQAVTRRGSIVPLRSARQEEEIKRRRFAFTLNATIAFMSHATVGLLPGVTPFVYGVQPWSSETPSGAVNSSNLVFTVTAAPTPLDAAALFVNGVLQIKSLTGDYTLSGTTITFNTGKAPHTGDVLLYVRLALG